jgi:hypothetical protein
MTQQKPKQWAGTKSDFVRAFPNVQSGELAKMAKQYGLAIKPSSVSAIRAMDRKTESQVVAKETAPTPDLYLSIPSINIETKGIASFIRDQVRQEVQAAFAKLSS